MKEDIFYMKIAYEEAQKAYKKGEIPVGCVIVDEQDGKILAQAHNLRDNTNIAVNHAEIIAIIKANKIIKNWRLVNCIMYSTLKPCEMCMEVIKNSKIKKVIYAAQPKTKIKNKRPIIRKIRNKDVSHECSKIITTAFLQIRKEKIKSI